MALSLTPRSRATWAADFPLLSPSFTASSLNSLVDTFWTFATSDPFPICLSLSHPWGLCQVGARLVNRTSTLLQSRLNTRRVNREWRILLFFSLVFFSIYYREAHG